MKTYNIPELERQLEVLRDTADMPEEVLGLGLFFFLGCGVGRSGVLDQLVKVSPHQDTETAVGVLEEGEA